MRHLINQLDFSFEETERLLELAVDISKDISKYEDRCKGNILATLFYEPSTRTRLSFESAMMRLGGNVLGFASSDSSSAVKGESISDTIRMISCYADIAVMRHFKEGAPEVARQYAEIPVVNAGDGGHLHPTQTLTDLLTIKLEKSNIDNLTVGLCGDLKFGRTVHSLVKSLIRYGSINFVFISPKELMVPEYIIEEVAGADGCEYEIAESIDEVIPKLDVLYMTRVQKERFFNEEDYVRLRDFYILDKAKMKKAKEDMIVMHPLPRVNEIATEVDNDKRAVYFKQAKNGVYVRMALILALLDKEKGILCEGDKV